MMRDLAPYAQYFDHAYPEYADVRYAGICGLVSMYDDKRAMSNIGSQEFLKWTQLVRPLVAIKNYKSQVPFPEDIQTALTVIADIRRAQIDSHDVFASHTGHLERLLGVQGFQLPTASAVLHFCHPASFPIVDVNVAAACKLLKDQHPRDFAGLECPKLPAPSTSAGNKCEKYKAFVAFIIKVRDSQAGFGGIPTYRYIDKALMVLGKAELRAKVEAGLAKRTH